MDDLNFFKSAFLQSKSEIPTLYSTLVNSFKGNGLAKALENSFGKNTTSILITCLSPCRNQESMTKTAIEYGYSFQLTEEELIKTPLEIQMEMINREKARVNINFYTFF